MLAIGGEKCVIELYSITSGQLVASLEGHTSRVKGLSLSPDNTLLFSASSNGAIRAWSLPKTLVRPLAEGLPQYSVELPNNWDQQFCPPLSEVKNGGCPL